MQVDHLFLMTTCAQTFIESPLWELTDLPLCAAPLCLRALMAIEEKPDAWQGQNL